MKMSGRVLAAILFAVAAAGYAEIGSAGPHGVAGGFHGMSSGGFAFTGAGTQRNAIIGTGHSAFIGIGLSGLGTGHSAIIGTGLNGLGTINQGSVETSNVNVVQELVNMIQVQRAYEMNSKAVSASDNMLQKLSQM